MRNKIFTWLQSVLLVVNLLAIIHSKTLIVTLSQKAAMER